MRLSVRSSRQKLLANFLALYIPEFKNQSVYIHNRDFLVCLLVYFAHMHPKNFKKGLEVLFWTKLQQGRVYINQYSTSLNKLVKYRLPMTLPKVFREIKISAFCCGCLLKNNCCWPVQFISS